MPHNPIVRHVSSRVACSSRKQQRADGGAAEAVEPERAVRFEHVAVRAHPASLPAAAGEIPLAGQAIASVNRPRARSVRRSPGHDAARIGEDGTIGRRLQKGGDQGRTVGDEYIPRDRGVVPGELFDRRHIDRRFRLVAARRTRQQHAEQPRVHAAAPAMPRGCAACARPRRRPLQSPLRDRGHGRPGPDGSGCSCATSPWSGYCDRTPERCQPSCRPI